MKIQFKEHTISNLTEWKMNVFSGKKEKHWKEGRSAYSLADFIINQKGVSKIEDMVSPLINETFVLEKGIPEYEVRFDKYGHGREHDLAIWGTTQSGKKIFIGIEAKVDEPFGDTIASAQQKASKKIERGEKTNALKRIDELLAFNFNNVSKEDLQLRYQLLFSTAGTLCIEADIHIMLVLVFKTNAYSPEKGVENRQAFETFFKRMGSTRNNNNSYTVSFKNNPLHIIYNEIMKYEDFSIKITKSGIIPVDRLKFNYKTCTSDYYKIYILKNDNSFVYVGLTIQQIGTKFGQGFKAYKNDIEKGMRISGYGGYKWIKEFMDKTLSLHIIELAWIDDKEQAEAIEAEIVFQIRQRYNRWPECQNEIHFNNDYSNASNDALKILDLLK